MIGALTGSLGLLAWSLVWFGGRAPAEPATDMHERYQVALEVPPVDAALWFVDRYPRYFTSGEDGLEPWLATLDPRDRDFVVAMAQTLTWAWVAQERRALAGDRPDELARAAIELIRRKTLNQLEISPSRYPDGEALVWDAWLGAPSFADGVFARLIRGESNCEGQNHLLALLLEHTLSPDHRVELAGIAVGHELVAVSEGELAQPLYVDAWSNLPPFVLDPDRPHAAQAYTSELAPLLPGLRGRPAEPASMYAESGRSHVELKPSADAPSKPVDLDVRAPSLDRRRLARVDAWRLFLYARVLHVYDDPRASELYQLFLDRECPEPRPASYRCAATYLLRARLDPVRTDR